MSSTKSLVRHALGERYPETYFKGTPPVPAPRPQTVVWDMLQLVRGIRKSDYIKTGRDVVKQFIKPVEQAFQMGSDVTTVMQCTDKSGTVFIAKSVEWVKRYANAPKPDTLPKTLSLDGELPDGFDSMADSRSTGRPQLMRWAYTQILAGHQPFPIPPGRRVILDGHCFGEDEFHLLKEVPERVRKYPFLLARMPLEINDVQEVIVREDLENNIGEADFTMPWLMNKAAPNTDTAVYSVDTDMIWVLFKYLQNTGTSSRILCRFQPKLTTFASETVAKEQAWIDIGAMKAAIEADPDLASLKDPLMSLAVACNGAGSDYSDPIAGITHKSWVAAILNWAPKIGDLWDEENRLVNYKNFYKLMQHACYERWKPRTAEKVPTLTKGARNWVPQDDNKLRALHTSHYLRALDQVAGDRGTFREENPCVFGYARVHNDQPLKAGNIKRLHEGIPLLGKGIPPFFDEENHPRFGDVPDGLFGERYRFDLSDPHQWSNWPDVVRVYDYEEDVVSESESESDTDVVDEFTVTVSEKFMSSSEVPLESAVGKIPEKGLDDARMAKIAQEISQYNLGSVDEDAGAEDRTVTRSPGVDFDDDHARKRYSEDDIDSLYARIAETFVQWRGSARKRSRSDTDAGPPADA